MFFEESFRCSERIAQRLKNPNSEDLASPWGKLEFKNSFLFWGGEIDSKGRVVSVQTQWSGEVLLEKAFVAAFVELAIGRDLAYWSKLTDRDLENYLRDDNTQKSYEGVLLLPVAEPCKCSLWESIIKKCQRQGKRDLAVRAATASKMYDWVEMGLVLQELCSLVSSWNLPVQQELALTNFYFNNDELDVALELKSDFAQLHLLKKAMANFLRESWSAYFPLAKLNIVVAQPGEKG